MIAILVVVVANPGHGRAEGSPMRALVGTFVYAGASERGRIMIDRVIELATEDMGFLRESIASDRLEEKTAIAPRIVIAYPAREWSDVAGALTSTLADGGRVDTGVAGAEALYDLVRSTVRTVGVPLDALPAPPRAPAEGPGPGHKHESD